MRLRGVLGVVVVVIVGGLSGFGQVANKYNDSVIRQIHDLADRRDAAGLLPFLKDTNPNYRGEALFCFGSIQVPELADSLLAAMQVEQQRVRMMGAWALGQIAKPAALPAIRKALLSEQDPLVRGMLYEALGKCGTDEDLNWLASIEVPFAESEGQAMGIFRFGLRNITTIAGNDRMMKILSAGTSQAGMVYASYFLARYAGMDWLQTKPAEVEQLFNNERNEEVRANLIKAVIRAKDEEAWFLCKSILESDADYRVKVNILNSMQLIPWNKAVKNVLQLVDGTDANLSVAAAEAVQRFAVYTDLGSLLQTIDKMANWRSRSLVLGKTLDLVSGKSGLVKKVEKMILESIGEAKSPTEKAWYIDALMSDPVQYTVLEEQLKNNPPAVVYTHSLETLAAMKRHKNFDVAAKALSAQGIDLKSEFSRIEAAYPMPVDPKAEYGHPIDWARVQKLDPKQKVAIQTSKGAFIVQLNVTWCPATCAAFTELIESGFYKNLTIHRVVPNFVMQDGCPRGDGWGGPPFTIRSEFSPTPFMEGTLGMASSGKDTEGSQWYITHSPTPHLDAKYTNFGFVIAGMEVVHKLEVGDTIIGMELIE
jgi:cyclophilin family peptidyl-prolyl cis-trans isomerase